MNLSKFRPALLSGLSALSIGVGGLLLAGGCSDNDHDYDHRERRERISYRDDRDHYDRRGEWHDDYWGRRDDRDWDRNRDRDRDRDRDWDRDRDRRD
jgi:hypothetical protein